MSEFSHLDAQGKGRMVDVSGKKVTRRVAKATCRVDLQPATIAGLASLPKGDVLTVAKIAGVQAAKRTSEWIPLTHPLPLEQVDLEFEVQDTSILISSRIVCTAKTGAEMEALTACSAAALTIYDMVKAVDREAVISDLRLEAKSGGKSGDYVRGAG